MLFPRRCFSVALILLLTLLTACGGNTPPKGLAPGKDIVKHAIARQLTLTEDRLTAQLDQAFPTNFTIQNLNIKTLNPVYIADLATYQISGTYTLKLNLPRQEVTQEKNQFEIYLQRQAEGKTWRLLIRDNDFSASNTNENKEEDTEEKVTAWKSYLVT